ncbi:MAG: hypothetical protein AVDCRST_MAG58-3317 [uncultured Rubrobacteraceae bacterium]|uniref:Uncharacterized protein n=1 Tax=uncultured Rubrobacteraceae bacterium TaxID=349277 RepID=A0A6J4RC04_9ACTN|nr:MAG: hypothetical protein AVDCRST_MAG58-3317 [uncultured Rubrobacteraceae bacterium]
MPPAPDFVTLKIPHFLVCVQYQLFATFGEILERDLTSQLTVRRTATAHRVAPGTEWILTHAHVEILAWLLQREKPREHGRVAFGGHAAVVIESDVARNAVRQEPVQSIPQGHLS